MLQQSAVYFLIN